MSSPGSPTLIIETPRRRTEAAAIALTLAGGALGPWLIDPLSAWTAALLSAGMLAVLALGFLQAGWVGDRRIVQICWTAAGRWVLTRRDGRTWEGVLHRQTRVAGGFLWLRWRRPDAVLAHRAMLLSGCDLPPADLRRLVARLRLESQRSDLQRTAPAVVGQ